MLDVVGSLCTSHESRPHIVSGPVTFDSVFRMSETKRPDAYKSVDSHGIKGIVSWFKGAARLDRSWVPMRNPGGQS